MTTQPPTIIPARTQEQWTKDLVNLFPAPWTSDLARLPGGVLYSVMGGIAANLQIINDFLVYGFDASRIATATDTELDLVSQDFYGINGLPRKTGESDTAFRMRIQAQMFIPYTTKAAFIQAITMMTGIAPRLIQPWNPVDTAAYNWRSFYDADQPNAPALYGDPALKFTAGVIATLPNPVDVEAPGPIWGYDGGAGYDTYTGTYWNLVAANFVSVTDLSALLLRIKAFGITIWAKYLNQGSLPVPLPATFQVASSRYVFPISIQAFNSPYVVIASCNWNATISVSNQSNVGFTLTASTPSPSLAPQISYVILPITFPGCGFVPVPAGASSVTIPIPQSPATSGQVVALTPNWNTSCYIQSIVGSTMTVGFGTASSSAASVLNYYFAPPTQAGYRTVANGAISAGIAVPALPTTPAMPAHSAVFCVPSWNAQVSVQPAAALITAGFNVPAPASGTPFVHWSYFPISGGNGPGT